jgi:hypothetical protein
VKKAHSTINKPTTYRHVTQSALKSSLSPSLSLLRNPNAHFRVHKSPQLAILGSVSYNRYCRQIFFEGSFLIILPSKNQGKFIITRTSVSLNRLIACITGRGKVKKLGNWSLFS